MKKIIILMIFSLLIFAVGCDDAPRGGNNNECNNKCSTEGVNSCSDSKLMICAKDADGCLVLTEVEVCANGCKNNTCINKIIEKKTKIVVGAGGKAKSASFKLKLNVGKLKSVKEMKSASYKMKVGNSVRK